MSFQKILGGLLTVMLAAILLAPANAQFIQQAKLTDAGSSDLGRSVSLSTDGNTALVGGDDASRVYIRQNGAWTLQKTLPVGGSVALSGDGNTAIVGFFDGTSFKVRVFIRTGNTWSPGVDLVKPNDADSRTCFGCSLGLSRDGTTAIVGGPVSDGPGAAWVYVHNGGAWSQQAKLYGNDTDFNNSSQGTSVALSADGNTAIVGGPYDGPSIDEPTGAAWIFVRHNGVWTQQGKKLVGTPNYLVTQTGQRQGHSVALSADGSTAIVGGPYDIAGPGGAWVFTRNNNTYVWSQQGPKLYDKDADAPGNEGGSVSLSADGNTAVVGGQGFVGYEGAVVFTRRNGLWTQQSSKVFGTDATPSGSQGFSLALSGDGNTLLIGGPYDNNTGGLLENGAGAAWVFVLPKVGPSPGWTRVSVPVGGVGGVTTNGADRNLEAVAYGTFQTNGSKFAIGGLGGNIITYDGSKVFNRVVASAGIEAVAFSDNGVAVAVADKGSLYRSTDGVTWAGQKISSNDFTGVAYANSGIFVAVQAAGRIFRSADYGQSWTESLNGGQLWTTHDLTGVVFGYSNTVGPAFVIVAKGGQTLYSNDYGVTWSTVDLIQYVCGLAPEDFPVCSQVPLAPAVNLQSVAFGHDEFVAVADTGAVFVSQDGGKSWAWTFVGPPATAHPLYGVGYGSNPNHEYFVAVGKDGATLIGPVDLSTGAISWYQTSFPTTLLRGVAFDTSKFRFVAVGYGATIVQSKLMPWLP